MTDFIVQMIVLAMFILSTAAIINVGCALWGGEEEVDGKHEKLAARRWISRPEEKSLSG